MFSETAEVEAAQAGDAEAFGRLLRAHDHKMRGVVWPLVADRAGMDDVLQEAYLKAWRSLKDFRGEARFGTWLYTIVHRAAIDAHRRSQTTRGWSTEALESLDHNSGPRSGTGPDVADGVVDRIALRQALAGLPTDQLAAVTLIDGEGHSYDEVADLLDVSAGTIASRVHRGRAKLRESLAVTGRVRRVK